MNESFQDKMEQVPLTTGEVADYCHVTYRAVLKWIAEGKITAYRTPGKHSRIKVEDFLAFLKKYNMPMAPSLKARLGHTKIRILIVDDDKQLVELIKTMLEKDPQYQVETAYDGFSGGHKLAAFLPDLVILDVNMPGLDGYTVCAQIRRQTEYKHVKILVISGIVPEEEKQKILAMGADDFLPKPFEQEMLLKKMERLLGIKKPASA